MRKLTEITYENRFVENFPGDESFESMPRLTPGVLHSRVKPTPVPLVQLLGWSTDLASELDIAKPLSPSQDLDILGGNYLASSMKSYAACYGGHQFGQWAGQLGDGRAITLGEIPMAHSHSWEIQLKGAGPTPYSRRADGLAVLRSSVREFLMSEAFHHLNIPTTRALSLVSTGTSVLRDLLYDGNPRYEPGAIVTRMAPSFLRFGSFQILSYRQESENLEKLLEWTLTEFYSHLTPTLSEAFPQWFEEVCERTARLIVEWCRVGFVHGVMNTDNMSILGLTMDYGPYGMMDSYDPSFTPNTTDLPGRRYAFDNQPAVALWNLEQLAEALSWLYPDKQVFENGLKKYEETFLTTYKKMMAAKLGWDKISKEDESLLRRLDEMLYHLEIDMTLFYSHLTDYAKEKFQNQQNISDPLNFFKDIFYQPLTESQQQRFLNWLNAYNQRFQQGSNPQAMIRVNPRFVLRNYLLQEAIEDLEKGKPTKFNRLYKVLQSPYKSSEDFGDLYRKRPAWALNKPGCSQLSCSS